MVPPDLKNAAIQKMKHIYRVLEKFYYERIFEEVKQDLGIAVQPLESMCSMSLDTPS